MITRKILIANKFPSFFNLLQNGRMMAASLGELHENSSLAQASPYIIRQFEAS